MAGQLADVEAPAMGLRQGGHVYQGHRIVGEQQDRFVLAHLTRGAQHWPGAFQAARVDPGRAGDLVGLRLSSSCCQRDCARCAG